MTICFFLRKLCKTIAMHVATILDFGAKGAHAAALQCTHIPDSVQIIDLAVPSFYK